MDDAAVDFQFKVSPTEQRIIHLPGTAPIILLGRSGTGKTTCAVFRMFGRWLANRHFEHQAWNQVRAVLTRLLRTLCGPA
jgi:hypothetical protein